MAAASAVDAGTGGSDRAGRPALGDLDPGEDTGRGEGEAGPALVGGPREDDPDHASARLDERAAGVARADEGADLVDLALDGGRAVDVRRDRDRTRMRTPAGWASSGVWPPG